MQVLLQSQESNVTQKGQITIPMYLRIKFGLQQGSKVSFDVEDDYIKIKPVLNLDSVFGSVKPLERKLSFKEMKKIAYEDKINAIY